MRILSASRLGLLILGTLVISGCEKSEKGPYTFSTARHAGQDFSVLYHNMDGEVVKEVDFIFRMDTMSRFGKKYREIERYTLVAPDPWYGPRKIAAYKRYYMYSVYSLEHNLNSAAGRSWDVLLAQDFVLINNIGKKVWEYKYSVDSADPGDSTLKWIGLLSAPRNYDLLFFTYGDSSSNPQKGLDIINKKGELIFHTTNILGKPIKGPLLPIISPNRRYRIYRNSGLVQNDSSEGPALIFDLNSIHALEIENMLGWPEFIGTDSLWFRTSPEEHEEWSLSEKFTF
ncbi:MAG: hypothetical protein ISR95_07430 [Candidatus Marinimicrobia bacterium]|nr:hypothetical protein [Candidatus Neomarinimicrobiota bacterium]